MIFRLVIINEYLKKTQYLNYINNNYYYNRNMNRGITLIYM